MNHDILSIIINDSKFNPFLFRFIVSFLKTFNTNLLKIIEDNDYRFHDFKTEIINTFEKIECVEMKKIVRKDIVLSLFSCIRSDGLKLRLNYNDMGDVELDVLEISDTKILSLNEFSIMINLGMTVKLSKKRRIDSELYCGVLKIYLINHLLDDLIEVIMGYGLFCDGFENRRMTRW